MKLTCCGDLFEISITGKYIFLTCPTCGTTVEIASKDMDMEAILDKLKNAKESE